ncbi:MAG: hypothetical protein ACRD1X_10285 [Vicinamibacteria bacterium]
MSTFSVKGSDIDVESVMATIRSRIEEKRKGLYTEEEVREIAEMKLDSVLDASQFNSDFVAAFRARDEQWNFTFGPETIYQSSRGLSGRFIRLARSVLNPVLKLFFNPNPIISSLSRQADLNRYYVSLLHNMAVELTKMNLELTNLKARLRDTGAKVEFQTRREKVLEDLTTSREEAGSGAENSGRRRSRSGRRPWRRRRGGRDNDERRPGGSERSPGGGSGGNDSGERSG